MNTFIEQKMEEFGKLQICDVMGHITEDKISKVEEFIRSALLEQQEQIVNIIQGNYKGSFTDDGGNDCWYVDDLVSIIKDLKN